MARVLKLPTEALNQEVRNAVMPELGTFGSMMTRDAIQRVVDRLVKRGSMVEYTQEGSRQAREYNLKPQGQS